MRGKKGRNYISRQACFESLHSSGVFKVERFTKQACREMQLRPLFPSHNIYSALLQRIEHCSTRKSTCRLPIYIYIYIYKNIYIYIKLIFSLYTRIRLSEPSCNDLLKKFFSLSFFFILFFISYYFTGWNGTPFVHSIP